ncbi:hypothetical protein [Polyangium spumosum]|uniref:Uncharacterized protein n=1 Tax=Polyangium spumosum TaxID=889282 RepID=A0A6N7PSE1_9BACT|nr:hypothetical protein [Polyangium spumosum]MRG92964.1 hypothetical protein [Polyangium spumosum]
MVEQARELVLQVLHALLQVVEELLQRGPRRIVDDLLVSLQNRVEVDRADLVEWPRNEIMQLHVELLEQIEPLREVRRLRGILEQPLPFGRDLDLQDGDVLRERRVDLGEREADLRAAVEGDPVAPDEEQRLGEYRAWARRGSRCPALGRSYRRRLPLPRRSGEDSSVIHASSCSMARPHGLAMHTTPVASRQARQWSDLRRQWTEGSPRLLLPRVPGPSTRGIAMLRRLHRG